MTAFHKNVIFEKINYISSTEKVLTYLLDVQKEFIPLKLTTCYSGRTDGLFKEKDI